MLGLIQCSERVANNYDACCLHRRKDRNRNSSPRFSDEWRWESATVRWYGGRFYLRRGRSSDLAGSQTMHLALKRALIRPGALLGLFVFTCGGGSAFLTLAAHSQAPGETARKQAAASQERLLVPRGSEKPSLDCAKAKTAAARLICADGELARLDGELGVAFQKRKAQTSAIDQSNLVAEQLAWIKDRNTHCDLDGKNSATIAMFASSKPCMATAIKERLTYLAQTGVTAASPQHPMVLVPPASSKSSGEMPDQQTAPILDAEKIVRDSDEASALTDKWIRCTRAVSHKLATTSDEPVETVMLATFGSCSQLEQDYYLRLLKGGMSVDQADELKAYARQTVREHMAADVLASRARTPAERSPPVANPALNSQQTDLDTFLRGYDLAEQAHDLESNRIYQAILGHEVDGMDWANTALKESRKELPLYCVPANLALTNNQLIDIVRRMRTDVPSLGKSPVGLVILFALQKTFPCSSTAN